MSRWSRDIRGMDLEPFPQVTRRKVTDGAENGPVASQIRQAASASSGRHVLSEPGQGMALLLQPRVDAARPGVRVSDRRSLRQVGRDIGHRRLRRPAVQQAAPGPDHHIGVTGQAHPRQRPGSCG